MKLQFFGDSYDIVKRWLMARIGGTWSALPMFTEHVADLDAAAYASFLGAQLVSGARLSPDTNRAQYFGACDTAGNLLLDPDTGVRIDRRVAGWRCPQFVFADELQHLVEARPAAVTLIFDQSLHRGQERADLERKLTHLHWRGISGLAYISHASFLLIACDPLRVNGAAEVLVGSGLPRRRLIETPQI